MLRIFEAHFREKIKNTEAQTKIHHSYNKKACISVQEDATDILNTPEYTNVITTSICHYQVALFSQRCVTRRRWCSPVCACACVYVFVCISVCVPRFFISNRFIKKQNDQNKTKNSQGYVQKRKKLHKKLHKEQRCCQILTILYKPLHWIIFKFRYNFLLSQ